MLSPLISHRRLRPSRACGWAPRAPAGCGVSLAVLIASMTVAPSLLRRLKRGVVQDRIALAAFNLPFPVLGHQQATGVLLRTPFADQAYMKLSHRAGGLVVVLPNPMNFLDSIHREGERVFFGGLDHAQMEQRAGLVLLDLAYGVVALKRVEHEPLLVGGHHVEALRPVVSDIHGGEIQPAFQEEAHEGALLEVGRRGVAALGHTDRKFGGGLFRSPQKRRLAIRVYANHSWRLDADIGRQSYGQECRGHAEKCQDHGAIGIAPQRPIVLVVLGIPHLTWKLRFVCFCFPLVDFLEPHTYFLRSHRMPETIRLTIPRNNRPKSFPMKKKINVATLLGR